MKKHLIARFLPGIFALGMYGCAPQQQYVNSPQNRVVNLEKIVSKKEQGEEKPKEENMPPSVNNNFDSPYLHKPQRVILSRFDPSSHPRKIEEDSSYYKKYLNADHDAILSSEELLDVNNDNKITDNDVESWFLKNIEKLSEEDKKYIAEIFISGLTQKDPHYYSSMFTYPENWKSSKGNVNFFAAKVANILAPNDVLKAIDDLFKTARWGSGNDTDSDYENCNKIANFGEVAIDACIKYAEGNLDERKTAMVALDRLNAGWSWDSKIKKGSVNIGKALDILVKTHANDIDYYVRDLAMRTLLGLEDKDLLMRIIQSKDPTYNLSKDGLARKLGSMQGWAYTRVMNLSARSLAVGQLAEKATRDQDGSLFDYLEREIIQNRSEDNQVRTEAIMNLGSYRDTFERTAAELLDREETIDFRKELCKGLDFFFENHGGFIQDAIYPFEPAEGVGEALLRQIRGEYGLRKENFEKIYGAFNSFIQELPATERQHLSGPERTLNKWYQYGLDRIKQREIRFKR